MFFLLFSFFVVSTSHPSLFVVSLLSLVSFLLLIYFSSFLINKKKNQFEYRERNKISFFFSSSLNFFNMKNSTIDMSMKTKIFILGYIYIEFSALSQM